MSKDALNYLRGYFDVDDWSDLIIIYLTCLRFPRLGWQLSFLLH